MDVAIFCLGIALGAAFGFTLAVAVVGRPVGWRVLGMRHPQPGETLYISVSSSVPDDDDGDEDVFATEPEPEAFRYN